MQRIGSSNSSTVATATCHLVVKSIQPIQTAQFAVRLSQRWTQALRLNWLEASPTAHLSHGPLNRLLSNLTRTGTVSLAVVEKPNLHRSRTVWMLKETESQCKALTMRQSASPRVVSKLSTITTSRGKASTHLEPTECESTSPIRDTTSQETRQHLQQRVLTSTSLLLEQPRLS